MKDFMIYRTAGDWCMRIVDPINVQAWDGQAGGMVAAPTYADTGLELKHDANIGGYPVALPETLPAGTYDLLFYNVAYGSAAANDSVVFGKRIEWNGSAIFGQLQDL